MASQKSSNEGSGGKLLDTWHYEYEGIDQPNQHGGGEADEEEGNGNAPPPKKRVIGKKVAVELRLIKKFTDSPKPPLAVKEVWFRVVCPEADIRIEGSDVELLRKEMFGRLDEKYAVQWSDYYLVQISHRRPFEGMGTGVDFSYSRVEKGVAWDGTLLLRQDHWGRNERIDPWPGEFTDDAGKTIACIPDTEENRKALKEFGQRVDKLRDMLADLLRPKNIMLTLSNLNGIGLLPAPEPGDVVDE